MAGKKSAGENSKRAAGNTRKNDAAAQKQAVKDKELQAQESSSWAKGSKDNSKAEAAAAKAAEAERKRAEKAALAAEEEASLPSKGPSKSKTAQKKTKGPTLDLSQLDQPSVAALNATGIDNALDALSLTSKADTQIDRHPERRFKAAYSQFEERRLEEMKDEKGLRRQQKIEQIRKEFEKHPDNPFNQVSGQYNSSRAELQDIQAQETAKMEQRLTNP